MTANQAAVQALADLALACGRAREAAQQADGETAALLLCRLAVEADAARARVEDMARDARAAGR